MDEVLGLGLGEDEDVIHVDLDEATQHRGGSSGPRGPESAVGVERRGGPAENGVHVPHQERRHAVEAKGTHAKLELAARHPEGRLVLVARPDPEVRLAIGASLVKKRALRVSSTSWST